MGWNIHFHELLEQPALVRDHLGPYAEEMRALIGSPDWLARICLLWRAVSDVIDTSLRPLPGVHVVRYEDLVRSPLTRFRHLYGVLGLTWSDKVRARLLAATTGAAGTDRSHAWSLRGGLSRTAYRPMTASRALSTYEQRLSPAEIARVRELTGYMMARFECAAVEPPPEGEF